MGKFLTTKVPTLPVVRETVDAVTGLPPSPPVALIVAPARGPAEPETVPATDPSPS